MQALDTERKEAKEVGGRISTKLMLPTVTTTIHKQELSEHS